MSRWMVPIRSGSRASAGGSGRGTAGAAVFPGAGQGVTLAWLVSSAAPATLWGFGDSSGVRLAMATAPLGGDDLGVDLDPLRQLPVREPVLGLAEGAEVEIPLPVVDAARGVGVGDRLHVEGRHPVPYDAVQGGENLVRRQAEEL